MNRAGLLLVIAALGAACSDTTDTPGALLRGPGALAAFDGVVKHGSGSQRKYLAIASTRGDELRLVDLTDNEVVSSPGLAFPLSVPVDGWPMWVAAADLGDGDKPDALVAIPSGSDVVEVVDTWSGEPTSILQVDLDADGTALDLEPDPRILSVASLASPSPGVGRILIGLTGERLAVLDFVRDAADPLGLAIAQPTLTVLTGLGFEPVSLAQGGEPYVAYAASRTTVGGTPGVARIALPFDLAGWDAAASVTALDALVPTQAVAALRMGSVERVIAVPAPGFCGEGRVLPCGLLAVDPAAGTLAAGVVAGETHLMPLPVPGTVAGLLALGRPDATITIASGSGTTLTRGVAVVSSTDGAVYLVDVERWTMISETNPLAGAGMTRVSDVSILAGAGALPSDGLLGLWSPAGAPAPDLTAEADALAGRIRLTPGFTPDDSWTLAWQGALPDLEARTAALTVTGASTATLTVPMDWIDPPGALDLAARGVLAGDLLELAPVGACTPGAQPGISVLSATEVGLTLPAGASWADVCVAAGTGETVTVAATFRAGGLVLSGAAHGLAGRPPRRDVAPAATADETSVSVDRRFYVDGACDDAATCDPAWLAAPWSLGFPYPDGPAVGLAAGFVDPGCPLGSTAADCAPGAPEPAQGTAVAFVTRSGLVPSPRRPRIDGSAVASALPSGLALLDPGTGGVQVQASYTAGLVMIFDSAAAITSMAVIH